jgi:energy-coupling factor transporter ATP-binding protein EcfA2
VSDRQGIEPHVRVDARRLESALLALRHRIVDAPLLLEAPGVDEARAQRRKLLTQIDDYLLPRIRQSTAPLLVALVGSTGAGKSTLVNSIVGAQVSLTGIRRPTTNSPVLACHPDDIDWFAENVFLPTMPRVRQQGLAMPGRDGLLVLAPVEGLPKGVALLDTPDIDSVVQAHHEFAHQFLDASDLWLFMTTASRYADAPVWELLRYARERDASLGIVLSRVPLRARSELTTHFTAMLEANGLGGTDRFVIPETVITNGLLPSAVYGPVKDWLHEVAEREDRRVAVLTQTMSGVLDTFRMKVPELAAHLATQLSLRVQLRQAVEHCYAGARAGIDEATRNGSLLSGETLARWQDFAGAGDLLRTLQSRRRSGASKPRKQRTSGRAQALKAALQSGLESLIVSVGDRAAEAAVARWRDQPAGAALLKRLPEQDRAWATRSGAHRVGGNGHSPFDDDVPAGLAGTDDWPSMPPLPGASAAPAAGDEEPAESSAAAAGLSAPDLPKRAAQAVSSWLDQVMHLVQAEEVTKRSIARVVSFDQELLALVVIVGLLSYGAGERGSGPEDAGGTVVSERGPAESGPDENGLAENRPPEGEPAGTGPAASGGGAASGAHGTAQILLSSLFGPGQLREIETKARAALGERVRLLFDEEMLRFVRLLDADGVPDESAAVQLYQATYSLEVVR